MFLLKINKIIIKFFSLFIFQKKRRKDFQNKYISKSIKKYLKKYLYVLDENINTEDIAEKRERDNNIFIFWDQSFDNAPEIVKICFNNIKKNIPLNYKLVILNDNNINDYIDIPKYILEKYKKKIITKAHFSDIIRVMLLENYGGIWIDATVLLLNQIPKNILDSDFFCFRTNDSIRNVSTNNWFLKSKKNFFIIKIVSNFLQDYWKYENRAVDYFLYHHFTELIIQNNIKIQNILKNIPYYSDENLYKNLSYEINENEFQKILDFPIYKLNHREFINKDINNSLYRRLKRKELI